MKEVYISIKPKFTHLIETKQKNYEFRKYFIKDLKTMFVYESENSCLKYIMEVGTPVMSPTQIEENGYGNDVFNRTDEKKYAYPILHLKRLKKPISLTELSSKYGFTAPQKYNMLDTYPKIKKDLENIETEGIY